MRSLINSRRAGLGRIVFFALLGALVLPAQGPSAQEKPGITIDQRHQELTEREGRLRREEERLKTIEKEVEAKIQKLNQLMSQVEEGLKRLEEKRSERLVHLVKSFEAMPPEEAALRLVSLEKSLAVQILFKMNNKKAGAVMASMEPKKVAEFTEGLSRIEKKIPTR
jgi:flagellar motility protein MotE (MotC chaperone)